MEQLLQKFEEHLTAQGKAPSTVKHALIYARGFIYTSNVTDLVTGEDPTDFGLFDQAGRSFPSQGEPSDMGLTVVFQVGQCVWPWNILCRSGL